MWIFFRCPTDSSSVGIHHDQQNLSDVDKLEQFSNKPVLPPFGAMLSVGLQQNKRYNMHAVPCAFSKP